MTTYRFFEASKDCCCLFESISCAPVIFWRGYFLHIVGKTWEWSHCTVQMIVGLSALLQNKRNIIVKCFWYTNACYVLLYAIFDINSLP